MEIKITATLRRNRDNLDMLETTHDVFKMEVIE